MWRSLIAIYPHWMTAGADFTPPGIKALFEVVASRAFAAGIRRGIYHAREIDRNERIRVVIRRNGRTVRTYCNGKFVEGQVTVEAQD